MYHFVFLGSSGTPAPSPPPAATTTVLEESRFILAEVGENKNKFWTVTLHSDFSVVTSWGRVGATAVTHTKPLVGSRGGRVPCDQGA